MRPLTACLLACLALLAGCGHGEPKAGPTTHAPSSVPGETPPTYPARARPTDAQGAANFVDYYIKLLDYAEHTGDTDELEKYSSEACEGCWNYIRLYQRLYSAGGYYRGTKRSVDKMYPETVSTKPASFRVYLTLRASAGTFRSSTRARLEKSNPSSADVAFTVEHSTEWIVTAYGLEAKS